MVGEDHDMHSNACDMFHDMFDHLSGHRRAHARPLNRFLAHFESQLLCKRGLMFLFHDMFVH